MADGMMARALALVRYAVTGNAPSDWFGPAQPLVPQAPESVRGRQYDFPAFINLNFQPRSEEPVNFAKLKLLAQNSNLLRIVMEGQKDKVEGLEWQLKARKKKGKEPATPSGIEAIEAILRYPDGVHDWSQWLRALLEQLWVLDAVSIYRRRDRGGRPYSFELLDGATIKVLLDSSGRRPMEPFPAYQQVLKGVPAVDYMADELLYYPQNFRADHAYGYSRVEWIIDTVETAIDRMRSQKSYFREGNLPEGFFTGGDDWQPDNLKSVETYWNFQMLGGPERRRQVPMMPNGLEWNDIKVAPLQDTFDEWLIRLICFPFGTAPTPFLKQQGLGHGSAQTDHEAAEEKGIANTMSYIKRLMDRILIEDFGRPDIEFDWVEDREFDPKTKADIEDKRLRNGSLLLDEVRDRNGEDPLPDGLGAKPLIYTASGATLLQDVLEPPEPPPVVAPPGAFPAPGAKPTAGGHEDQPAGTSLKKAAKGRAAAEKRLAKLLTKFLAAKAAEIAPILGEKLGLAKADPSDDQTGRIEAALEDVDWDWTPLADQVAPILTGVAVAAGKEATSELGLFDPAILKRMTANATGYAEDRAAEMVGKRLVDGELVDNPDAEWTISDATRDMVRSTVTKGIEEGWSNDQLATELRDSEAFSKARAQTIARTETSKADVNGSVAGWRASGLVAGREWSASANCCDECQALDGTVVGIDDEFEDGDPPLHPNCECTLLPVLPEDMPDAGDSDEED